MKNQLTLRNLNDLKAERARQQALLEQSRQNLEQILHGMPGLAFRGAVETLVGGVWKRVTKKKRQKMAREANLASGKDKAAADNSSWQNTLADVGQETAFYALSRLLERVVGGK